ncbi:bifunctional folylpolyglutamate synthase/dihydrofolate synthase [Rhodobacterales bacterium 52_120_T64]|nr:bifunctional folylpolyglutamate synthase/dihydrofolate synthase [Rhodobacterales bacterium 52_120_T64]
MSDSDIILERMMSLHPKIIDLTLDRMVRLLDALGNPEKHLPPVIHLAGTNGKGSTQAMIRAGLEADNDRVHAYTSPHLARFHERIRLAGELITEEALTEILDECVVANDGITITYFEITTCAALLAFSRTDAEYTLLETGLGGRLDATNMVEVPRLCVITPISIDHTQYLGETIEEIATEKAGILKRGVYCVVGPQEDAALEVIEAQAAKVGAALLIHGQHWQVWEENGRLVYQDENGLLDLPLPNLIGAHQVQNAGAAIAALRALGKNEAACEAAITTAQWPARLQRLRHGPLVQAAGQAELWLDGGHNPAAGQALVEALQRLPSRPTYLICGVLNTKDITGYLAPLAEISTGLYGVSIEGEAATLAASETVTAARSVGMVAEESPSVADAIDKITSKDPTARILICGSLYLAGRILQENG